MNDVIHAFSTALPPAASGSPPSEIQWMPPGTQEITAMRDGKPITVNVSVSHKTAEVMAALLEVFRVKAAAGVEDRPYIDFNHSDAEAAGHITAFTWGGEDPVKGGVRAQVEWTAPGREAIEGRAYRRFSPSFFVNANGEVTGAPLNMGGLVNKAAFKNIAPIWSRSGGDQVTNTTEQMDPKDKELADLKTALADSQRQLTEVNAKLAANNNDQAIKAKDAEIGTIKTQHAAEITTLKARIAEMEKAALEATKVDARSAVAAAVANGQIPPQNTELQKHYEELYLASPVHAKAALANLPKVTIQGTIITAANGGAAAGAAASGAGTEAEQFVQAVKAKVAELTSGSAPLTPIKAKSVAIDAVMAAQPKLYEAWHNANGKPGLN